MEIIAETSLGYTFSEPLTSFIRPAYTIVSEEPEILESLGQKMLSSHTSGQVIVSSNVRYLSKFPDEILSQSHNSVLSEQSDIVIRIKLSNDDICTSFLSPGNHSFQAKLVLI